MTTHGKLTVFPSQQWVHEVSSFHASRALPPSDAWPLGSQDLHLTLDVLGQKSKTTSYTREKHEWHRDFPSYYEAGHRRDDRRPSVQRRLEHCQMQTHLLLHWGLWFPRCQIHGFNLCGAEEITSQGQILWKCDQRKVRRWSMIRERWWLAIPPAPHERALPRIVSPTTNKSVADMRTYYVIHTIYTNSVMMTHLATRLIHQGTYHFIHKCMLNIIMYQ